MAFTVPTPLLEDLSRTSPDLRFETEKDDSFLVSPPSGPRITTASPRSKLPSTRVTPAESRLLPARNARAAPASR